MGASLERQLALAVADDARIGPFRIVAPDLSPDGRRAGALVLYETSPERTPFQAFFERDGDEWIERGQIDGLGPGEWDFGDLSYPYLSGRIEGGISAVELRLVIEQLRRPVVDGWYIGVFWNAGLPWG